MRLHEPAAASAFAARVAGVLRRIRAADVLASGAAACAAGFLAVLAATTSGASPGTVRVISGATATVVFGLLLWRARQSWTSKAAADRLERAYPDSRNVIVTAEELLRHPSRARGGVRERVVRDAAAASERVDIARAVPLARPAAAFAAALIAWAAAAAWMPHAFDRDTRQPPHPPGAAEAAQPGPPEVAATLAPPAYLDLPAEQMKNPARIEAVSGTRLTVTVTGGGGRWRIRLGPETLESQPIAGGVQAGAILDESSYLAIDAPGGAEEPRQLIPVIVAADRAPVIRIDRPAKDLVFSEPSGEVPIAATATDDFGLASLELRYTRVSGSGEQFEFEEGAIPLSLERQSARAWTGRTSLALERLRLQPGDALVYRVVGADHRPAGGEAASDTFFVEIAGSDQVTLAGFELPPDKDRYALSQQMILLKIERLRAREPRMTREAAAEEAEAIAVEQRSVRANFVFLTGGHVEDEEEEAAHSHEIQEGRLEHRARSYIQEAIGHMSRVEQVLVSGEIGGAIPPARAAVEALERAFRSSRYLLRSLPVRSRLDPSRRLTGDLAEARDSRRVVQEPEAGEGPRAARDILAGLLDARGGGTPRPDPKRLTALAERALAVDAGAETWRSVAGALLQLRDAVANGQGGADIETLFARAVRLLRTEAMRGAVPAPAPDTRDRALAGAWAAEAVRR